MTEKDIYKKLTEVFVSVFDNDDITLSAETVADDIDEWDSLEHITLISAVEKDFGMKFTMGEVSSMKNVGEMVGIIQSRI